MPPKNLRNPKSSEQTLVTDPAKNLVVKNSYERVLPVNAKSVPGIEIVLKDWHFDNSIQEKHAFASRFRLGNLCDKDTLPAVKNEFSNANNIDFVAELTELDDILLGTGGSRDRLFSSPLTLNDQILDGSCQTKSSELQ